MYKIRTRLGNMKKALSIYVLVWVLVSSLSFLQRPAQGVGDNFLYAVGLGQPGKILKIDLNTFQIVSTMILNPGENGAHAVDIDDEYLYVGLLGSRPAMVIKVRLSDFSRANAATLPEGFQLVISVRVSGNYLYVTCYGPGQVAQLNASTLELIKTAVTPTGTQAIDSIQVGDYLYVSSKIDPGTVSYLQKFRVSDLSEVARIQLSLAQAHFMSFIDNYLYVVSNAVPAGLVKIDLDTFQEVASVQFMTGDNKGDSDFVVRYGDYLLTNGDSVPGRVYRTRLSTFTWMDYLDLSVNAACDLEVAGKYLYVSGVVSPRGIVKVDLDTFKEVNQLYTGEADMFTQLAVGKGALPPPPPPQQWSLTVGSNLTSGVPVTIDGSMVGNTPVSVTVTSGSHTVAVPSNVGNYNFLWWEDGFTSSTRTINILADTTITAYYKTASTPPPPHRFFLAVNSSPIVGVFFTLDASRYKTPYSTTLSEGSHTLAMPSSVIVAGITYNFKNWEDGSMNPTIVINLARNTSVTAYYEKESAHPPPPEAPRYSFPVKEVIAAAIAFASVITIAAWFLKSRKKPEKS